MAAIKEEPIVITNRQSSVITVTVPTGLNVEVDSEEAKSVTPLSKKSHSRNGIL